MKKILFIFVILTLSSLSFANDDSQKQIAELFDQLKLSIDYANSEEIESQICDIGTTDPYEKGTTELLS